MDKNKGFAGFIKKNIAIKILALVLAVLLWSYVLVYSGVEREKTVKGVSVYFEGESTLNDENYVIQGDKNAILSDVDVTVKVAVPNAAYVTNNNISATIDLKDIHSAGTHTLKINAVSSTGAQVLAVNPETVDVTVDVLSSVTVPVQAQFEGELPQGYWRGEADLLPSTIVISGPLSEIEKVKQAVCYISLDGKKTSFNSTMRVVLLDANGVVVDDSNFFGELPSVILRMDILPKKTVKLDITSALKGADQLKRNYEIRTVSASPQSVEIAAPQSLLDTINSLQIDSISLQGADTSVILTSNIIAPAGVRLIDATNTEVYVNIGEKVGQELFENVKISVEGLDKNHTCKLETEKATVSVLGPISQTNRLSRSNVKLNIDVTGLDAGTYVLPVQLTLPTEVKDATTSITPASITAVIKRR